MQGGDQAGEAEGKRQKAEGKGKGQRAKDKGQRADAPPVAAAEQSRPTGVLDIRRQEFVVTCRLGGVPLIDVVDMQMGC
jgi:hypothetical protein